MADSKNGWRVRYGYRKFSARTFVNTFVLIKINNRFISLFCSLLVLVSLLDWNVGSVSVPSRAGGVWAFWRRWRLRTGAGVAAPHLPSTWPGARWHCPPLSSTSSRSIHLLCNTHTHTHTHTEEKGKTSDVRKGVNVHRKNQTPKSSIRDCQKMIFLHLVTHTNTHSPAHTHTRARARRRIRRYEENNFLRPPTYSDTNKLKHAL